ncbi:hypothetical protein NL676_014390 [Syzygium grande]|nr:hypothetical protein NL676_014390 [Syzygium grande]
MAGNLLDLTGTRLLELIGACCDQRKSRPRNLQKINEATANVLDEQLSMAGATLVQVGDEREQRQARHASSGRLGVGTTAMMGGGSTAAAGELVGLKSTAAHVDVGSGHNSGSSRTSLDWRGRSVVSRRSSSGQHHRCKFGIGMRICTKKVASGRWTKEEPP